MTSNPGPRCCWLLLGISLCLMDCADLSAQDQSEPAAAFLKIDVDFDKLRENGALRSFIEHGPPEMFAMPLFGPDTSMSDFKQVRACLAPSAAEQVILSAELEQAIEERIEKEGLNGPFESEEKAEAAFRKSQQIRDEMNKPINEMPIDVFYQIVFTSKQAAEKFLASQMMPEDLQKETVNGVLVLRDPKRKWVRFYYDNSNTVTLSSVGFPGETNGFSGTPVVEDFFSKHPTCAVRIAIDIEPLRPLIEKAKSIDMFPPMAFGVIKAIKSSGIAFDLANDRMLDLVVNTQDESDAELIASQINGFLRMARAQSTEMATELFVDNKGDQKLFLDMVKDLQCEVDGAATTFAVNKPDGFDDMFERFAGRLGAAAAKSQKQTNYRKAAVAVLDAASAYERFPFAEPAKPEFSKELSWRAVALLYMDFEEYQVGEQFEFLEGWNSEKNQPLAKMMPAVFGTGETTSICWVKTVDHPLNHEDITDGHSNTIMLMENPNKVHWTKPGDLTIDEAVALVKNLKDGQELVVVFYDARVETVSNKMDLDQFKAMLTINGGEEVDWSEIK